MIIKLVIDQSLLKGFILLPCTLCHGSGKLVSKRTGFGCWLHCVTTSFHMLKLRIVYQTMSVTTFLGKASLHPQHVSFFVWLRMCACFRVCSSASVYVSFMNIYVCLRMLVFVSCVCVSMCVCVHACTCMYVYLWFGVCLCICLCTRVSVSLPAEQQTNSCVTMTNS